MKRTLVFFAAAATMVMLASCGKSSTSVAGTYVLDTPQNYGLLIVEATGDGVVKYWNGKDTNASRLEQAIIHKAEGNTWSYRYPGNYPDGRPASSWVPFTVSNNGAVLIDSSSRIWTRR